MKVSIIIPSYNTAHYVTEAIDSVLKSTLHDYEIIIVDDESSDNTKDVLTPYIEKYSFIKYIFQKNKGLAGARNTGINNSTGEYLVFLDSDDLIYPEKLKKQSGFLDSKLKVDLCYSKSINFIEDDVNNKLPANFPVFEGDVLADLWYGNFIHVNSVMVRRKAVNNVGNFNETYRELEDWDLWLRLAITGTKFAHLPEILSMVRVHKSSMTANQAKMDKAMVKVLMNLSNLLHSKKTLYNTHKYNYWKAIGLFMIKAKSSNFVKTLNKGLSANGGIFFPIYFKLLVKRILFPVLGNQKKTTKKLEKIWNKHED